MVSLIAVAGIVLAPSGLPLLSLRHYETYARIITAVSERVA